MDTAPELGGRRRLTAVGEPQTRGEGRRPPGDLIAALTEVRAAVVEATFPLDLPSAPAARTAASALLAQLDDYLVPRLRQVDAPLLAVVGGSTGAGKSTLVNSLVQAPVSRTGVLRPTTRSPLLVSNPTDLGWFARGETLPQLARSSRAGDHTLQLVNAPALRPGVALLDAPDIDSVVTANRELARELLAAGDLWLFVTTAARYADAVPWRLLREARDRGTAIAIVLDRVAAEVSGDVAAHFGQMLAAQDLGDEPLFVVHESTLDGHGLLPEPQVRPIKQWLDEVALSTNRRRAISSRTLLGAVRSVPVRVDELALAADDQAAVPARLTIVARQSFTTAISDVESQLRAGAGLRGEVYAQWLSLLAGDELDLALRSATAKGDEALPVRANQAHPGRAFLAAVAVALAGLITEADVTATRRCRDGWRSEPSGRALLVADATLGRPWAGFTDAAHDVVHHWQRWLQALIRSDAPPVRTPSRSYATAATMLAVTIAAIAPARSAVTGQSPAPAMLRRLLDDERLVGLGERTRRDLIVRAGALLEAELDRHLAPIAAVAADPGLGHRLRMAANHVRRADPTSRSGAAA